MSSPGRAPSYKERNVDSVDTIARDRAREVVLPTRLAQIAGNRPLRSSVQQYPLAQKVLAAVPFHEREQRALSYCTLIF